MSEETGNQPAAGGDNFIWGLLKPIIDVLAKLPLIGPLIQQFIPGNEETITDMASNWFASTTIGKAFGFKPTTGTPAPETQTASNDTPAPTGNTSAPPATPPVVATVAPSTQNRAAVASSNARKEFNNIPGPVLRPAPTGGRGVGAGPGPNRG